MARALANPHRRAHVFHYRARHLADRLDDRFAIEMMTFWHHTELILDLAGDASQVVEIGTAAGWTSCALALDKRRRTVRTFDPYNRGQRARYLRLAGGAAKRITVYDRPGEEPDGLPVDFLFIDGLHEHDPIVREFRAWQPLLLPGATVAFHDYEWPGHPTEKQHPGVAAAIETLGLDGKNVQGVFVWESQG